MVVLSAVLPQGSLIVLLENDYQNPCPNIFHPIRPLPAAKTTYEVGRVNIGLQERLERYSMAYLSRIPFIRMGVHLLHTHKNHIPMRRHLLK